MKVNGHGTDRCPAEVRAKISATLTGTHHAPTPAEVREKIAAAQRGDRGANWAGDDVGYMGMHKRARAALPLACFSMDGSCAGPLDAALRHEVPAEFTRLSSYGTHSVRLEDYVRLCRSHHVRYDRDHHALARA